MNEINVEESLDLKKMAKMLYQHIKIIVACGVIGAIVVNLYMLTLQPQYQTTALLQVNMQASSNPIGMLGLRPSDVSLIDTELALIPTSYVLKSVIEKYGLNIAIMPHYFPLFGKWLAERHHDAPLQRPLWGLKRYAWGGERLKIAQFILPNDSENRKFILIAGQDGHYSLHTLSGHFILDGKVGEAAISHINPGMQLTLSQLQANQGEEFFIQYEDPSDVSAILANQLKISKVDGNNPYYPFQTTGILRLQLTGSEPRRIIAALNAILDYAVSRNLEQKKQESARVIDFLNKQLPELKSNVIAAENKLNKYHSSTETLNSSLSSQMLFQQLMKVKENLEDSQLNKVNLLQTYTAHHPLVIAENKKIEGLREKLNGLIVQIKNFSHIYQYEMDLESDIKIKKEMFMAMLTRLQQLEVANAGIVSDITILNEATSPAGVPSYLMLKTVMGFAFGLLGSSLMVLLITMMMKRPEEWEHDIERALKIPVRLILPFSKKQKAIDKFYSKNAVMQPDFYEQLLSNRDPRDIVVEKLRDLQFHLSHMKNFSKGGIVTFLGSKSAIGKTFVSANFANVIAESGKKTLLIDGDLRKGRLHRLLFQKNNIGLGDYLEGQCHLDDIVKCIGENLFFISSGICKAHPIELLQNKRMQDLMMAIKKDFAHIIIDTPPLMAVSDALLIAQHSNINLFIMSAVTDDIILVRQNIKKARDYHVEVDGIVLNNHHSLINHESDYFYASPQEGHAKEGQL